MIPVLEVDVADDEAETFMTTYDAVGLMAGLDLEAWRRLRERVEPPNASLRRMLANFDAEALDTETGIVEELEDVPGKDRTMRDQAEDYESHFTDDLVLLVSHVQDMAILLDKLNMKPEEDANWRIIPASKLLSSLGPTD